MNRPHGLSCLAGAALGAAVLATGCSVNTNNPAPPAPVVAGGCAQDPSVSGCAGNSTGFSCTGGQPPSDPSLACSVGTPAAGATLYCCVDFSSTTCAPDQSVQGCTGFSFGFSCTGSDRPDEADSSLVCSRPSPGNGALLYCCTD